MTDGIEEAKRRIEESDRMLAEREKGGRLGEYEMIAHLRQTAGAIALIAVAERIDQEIEDQESEAVRAAS